MARPIRTVVYLAVLLLGLVVLVTRYPPSPPASSKSAKPAGESEMTPPRMEELLTGLRDDIRQAPDTILLIGDSAFLPHGPPGSEVSLQASLEREAPASGMRLRVLAHPGFDALAYLCLADEVAALHPRAVVLTANLQAFSDKWFRDLKIKHPDLVAFIRPTRWWEVLRLPLEGAGITPASIVLLPVLRVFRMDGSLDALRDARDAFRANLFSGFASEAHAATTDEPAAPSRPAPPMPPQRKKRAAPVGRPALSPFARTDYYPDHLRADAPSVRVFETAVRALTRRGIPTYVIIPPVHLQALRISRQYELRDIGNGIAVVAGAATAAGGRVIDLSAALPEERYFADPYTHFTDEGVAIVSAAALRALASTLTP